MAALAMERVEANKAASLEVVQRVEATMAAAELSPRRGRSLLLQVTALRGVASQVPSSAR